MVPREPEDASDHGGTSASDSEDEDSELELGESTEQLNQVSQEALEMEEEYHTEESDGDVANEEEEEDDDDGSEAEAPAPGAPLLPLELLKPQLPSPAYSMQNALSIPWEQMTRKQKIAQRNRNIQAKKKVWNRLRRETKGTGVLEAGKFAQLKRGIVPAKNRVKTGRVEKKTKAVTSGRQQLLEHRKRKVEQDASELVRPSKKSRTKSKR